MERWSGPGRALEIHLAEYEDARRVRRMIEKTLEMAGPGREVTVQSPPQRMVTWISFARTYGYWAKQFDAHETLLSDGLTNGLPEIKLGAADNAMGQNLMNMEYSMLAEGVTHYVSEPIVDSIEYAASQAEPEAIYPTDLVVPHGFAVLEHPLLIPDLHPDTGHLNWDILIPIRAIGWYSTEVGSIAARSSYHSMGNTHREKLTEEEAEAILAENETGPGVVLFSYSDSASYNEIYVPSISQVMGQPEQEMEHRRFLSPVDVAPWKCGRPWVESDDASALDPVYTPTNVGILRRWFMTFMRFMWQELLVTRPERPNRSQLRRLQRAQFPGDGYVKVMHMRKNVMVDVQEPGTGTGNTLMWRHRVRAHPRRQWYPSLGPARLNDGTMNPESHRLVWIEEFIKGPEDAPFIDGFDVTAVVR